LAETYASLPGVCQKQRTRSTSVKVNVGSREALLQIASAVLLAALV
jgi:hypothetical protein